MLESGFMLFCAICVGAAGLYAALRLDPVWMFCAGLAALMFSGHWGDLGFPEGIPLKPDRLLLITAFAMVLIRTPGAPPRPAIRLGVTHVLLGLTLLYALVSAWISGTLSEQTPLFGLLDRLGLFPFLAYTLAPALFGTRKQRQILLGTLVAMGAYLGVTAFLETVELSSFIVPSYITDPNVGITFGRARGPFVQSTALGLSLFAALVACAVMLSSDGSRRLRPWLMLVMVLCLGGMLFTLTRAIWVAAVASGLTVALVSPGVRRSLIPTALATSVLVLLAIVAIPGLGARAQARTDDQRPIWDRYNTNVAALRIVEERPLFGVGWGRYPEVNGHYMRQSDAYPLTGVGLEVHNVPLGNVAELGLVGGALWLAALTAAVGGAVRRRPGTRLDPLQLGLVAVATNWLVVAMFVPLGYPLPNMLLWTWAGVATVLAAPRRAPSPARLPRPGMSTSVAS